MTSRTCPRCHSTLHVEDANSLVFCWNCGAPQITLSEELQEQLEQQNIPSNAAGSAPAFFPDTRTDPEGVLWSLVIQLCGLAGVVLISLFLVTAAFGPAIFLTMLWIIGAPIILIGVYSARRPATRITAAFGAQFGLLTGIAIAAAFAVITTISAVLTRFAFHQGATLDANFTTVFNNLRAQPMPASATPADAAAIQEFLQKFTIPEFRLGMILTSFLGFFLFYMFYAAVTGAFAGYLRSRAAAR